MYDWAHGQCDSIEKITHSLCSLEYENHRPLYDWFLDQLGIWHPRQMEFARLNLTYTVLSKRRLLKIHNEIGIEWDDPRMPTLAAIRRRGYTPEAIANFARLIGVDKKESTVDIQLLEHCVREDLNKRSTRAMAVLKPLEARHRQLPRRQDRGDGGGQQSRGPLRRHAEGRPSRRCSTSSRTISAKCRRPSTIASSPGRKCACATRTSSSAPAWSRTRRPATSPRSTAPTTPRRAAATRPTAARSRRPSTGSRPSTRRSPRCASTTTSSRRKTPPTSPRASIGWPISTPIRSKSSPTPASSPRSPSAPAGSRWQFERLGYFCVDRDSTPGRLVFNRTVSLKDTWARIEKSQKALIRPPVNEKGRPCGRPFVYAQRFFAFTRGASAPTAACCWPS